jgi:Fic family protein
LSENEHIFATCTEIAIKMDTTTGFDREKPFNQLPKLPPSQEIIDKEVLIEWGLASRNLAALNKNLQRLPDQLMLVNTISLREAKSSSEIENIFTTDDELYKAISQTLREEQATGAAKEVLRYREALWTGFSNMKETGSITLETLIKVFQQVKNTSQRIRSPQSKVVIRRGNIEFRSGEVIYTPPQGRRCC